MVLRTIQINDDLQERVDDCISEITDILREYIRENDCDETPDLYNDLDYSGRVHELIDGNVPTATYHLRCLWFLYRDEFIDAYENAGIGRDPTENDGMAAIYFYIQEKINEWYNDSAEGIFNEERELLDAAQAKDDFDKEDALAEDSRDLTDDLTGPTPSEDNHGPL